MGQPELRDRLNNPNLAPTSPAHHGAVHLPPLSQARSAITSAIGSKFRAPRALPHFTRPALWRVHHYSGGIPRLVNAVCDKALLAGFVNQTDQLDYRMIGAAIRELEGGV